MNVQPRVTVVAACSAAVALVFAAGGCGRQAYVTVPRGEDVEGGLAKARSSRFPVYYVGRSFAGLPLTEVDFDGPDRALITYGTCRIALPADGGCSVPVQIQHFPFKSGDWRLAVNCHRRPTLLGVPTVRHDGLVLFTGTRIVKIYARTPAEDRSVALALRTVAGDEAVGRLPPPPRAVMKIQAQVCR
jgi:hypothetical protein